MGFGRLIQLERHRLGPRVYVLGQRIHECALGIGLLVAAPAAVLMPDFTHPRTAVSVAGTGLWLVVKDWRDLVPSKRNTAAWSLLPHRCPRDERE